MASRRWTSSLLDQSLPPAVYILPHSHLSLSLSPLQKTKEHSKKNPISLSQLTARP
uniref:Uncharacterized protein n=1 Tax=Arundo donax TaxID=35708 RepID=A0A0A9HNH2_ARUDO